MSLTLSPKTNSSAGGKKSAVVLLSAGLDSTYNLYEAIAQGVQVVLALTFNYGQRAAAREIAQAQKICLSVKVPHKVIELEWFAQFTKSSLVNQSETVPVARDVDIESHTVSLKTAEKVWVPNRNGIFLNIAAGFAEGLGAGVVIPGFNIEEAETFPDNSQEFMTTLDQSLKLSTANGVTVQCFSVALNKIQIVKRAVELGVPIRDIWPCYFDGARRCGQCESCLRFERALKANHVEA